MYEGPNYIGPSVWADSVTGISQRDTNFYDHLQDLETRSTICETIRAFWEDELLDDYDGGRDCEWAPEGKVTHQ